MLVTSKFILFPQGFQKVHSQGRLKSGLCGEELSFILTLIVTMYTCIVRANKESIYLILNHILDLERTRTFDWIIVLILLLTNNPIMQSNVAWTTQADLGQYSLQIHLAPLSQKMTHLYVDLHVHASHAREMYFSLLLINTSALRAFESFNLSFESLNTSFFLKFLR